MIHYKPARGALAAAGTLGIDGECWGLVMLVNPLQQYLATRVVEAKELGAGLPEPDG